MLRSSRLRRLALRHPFWRRSKPTKSKPDMFTTLPSETLETVASFLAYRDVSSNYII